MRTQHKADRSAPRQLHAWLTLEEAAEYVRASRSAYYRGRRDGTYPPGKRFPSGRVMTRRDDLDATIESFPEAA